MWSALCVAFLPIVAVTGQVTLEQPRKMTIDQGKSVTFECSMKGGDMSNYFMYWYRQGPQGTLEWIYSEDDKYGEGFQGGFKGRVESSRTTLQILSAKQGDAATYYCGASTKDAWVLGWGTAKLIFGPGTSLTVKPSTPNSSDPQVLVMKSKKLEEGGSTGKAACLARNFLTENINLEMPSKEVVYKQSTPVLTSEGLYNAIKVVTVTGDTEVTCTAKFGNSTITTQPEEEAEEPIKGAHDRVCNSTEPSAQDAEGQRVNMLSMAVLGLRVLLAKSIAINTLMSIKLFLF